MDRLTLLELHHLAKERGDGLVPGFIDLFCDSMKEGLPGSNVVDITEKLERSRDDQPSPRSNDHFHARG